jgi:hypothetical protein
MQLSSMVRVITSTNTPRTFNEHTVRLECIICPETTINKLTPMTGSAVSILLAQRTSHEALQFQFSMGTSTYPYICIKYEMCLIQQGITMLAYCFLLAQAKRQMCLVQHRISAYCFDLAHAKHQMCQSKTELTLPSAFYWHTLNIKYV